VSGPAAGPAPAAGPVGFVGLGNMGRRMAANLVAAGFPLVVRDSDAGAQQRFVAGHGGEAATSPRSFAEAEVVVTMLPDSSAVREAILGWDGGIAAALKPGAVVLDMSSSDPVGTKALAQDLAPAGVRVIDAPVSAGSPGPRRARCRSWSAGRTRTRSRRCSRCSRRWASGSSGPGRSDPGTR
jgi:3-hydroxyisobutyrate dehydrogenase and related beta-hydroxyacid dehydrogenases